MYTIVLLVMSSTASIVKPDALGNNHHFIFLHKSSLLCYVTYTMTLQEDLLWEQSFYGENNLQNTVLLKPMIVTKLLALNWKKY